MSQIEGVPYLKKALKEWAVVIEALKSGEQIVLLRKGGILDPGFDVEAPIFFLYPTYLHQSQPQIRPPFLPILEKVEKGKPKGGKIEITSLAQVVDSKETSDPEILKKISEKTIYTPETLLDRYRLFRPEESIKILSVRTYLLDQPRTIQERKSYRGCRSWIDLEETLEVGKPHAVLSEVEFQKRCKEIRHILTPSTSSPQRGEGEDEGKEL